MVRVAFGPTSEERSAPGSKSRTDSESLVEGATVEARDRWCPLVGTASEGCRDCETVERMAERV